MATARTNSREHLNGPRCAVSGMRMRSLYVSGASGDMVDSATHGHGRYVASSPDRRAGSGRELSGESGGPFSLCAQSGIKDVVGVFHGRV